MKLKPVAHWTETSRVPRFPQLKRNLIVDVVVVGGGIAGATAAYGLKQRGHRVALLERGTCGARDTACTTAHLTCVTDTRLHVLVKTFGKEHARAVWDAGMAAIDHITANIRDAEIDCDFHWVDGYLHAAPQQGRRSVRGLEEDARWARELGFDAEFVEDTPYFDVPGVRVRHQARFHPLKYLGGLLRAIPGGGSHVFEMTEVTRFGENPLSVTAGNYAIQCSYVVIATHTPLMGNSGVVPATVLQSRLYPYTSYVVAARVPKGLIPDVLFWDTAEPYHYLRLDTQENVDTVIFGGADHKTGQVTDTKAAYRRLERVLQQRISEAVPTQYWSGQVIETNDGLPFMGETAEHQFAMTGFTGNGMTFGTMGAVMAIDAFEGRKHPWADLFSPRRKKLRGGTWTYLKENRDYPYYMLRDRIAGAEGTSLNDLRKNEGKILSLHGEKVAAYRDSDGRVTLCSPVCTHLNCIVAWNQTEKTWDCPCHGSRFGPTGKVLAGPAERDLERVTDQGRMRPKEKTEYEKQS